MINGKTAAYCTLGCKVNQYDTDCMIAIMEEAGYKTVSFDDVADIYVINTCTVTHISDRKSRQMINRAHRKNPNAIIVVAGCYAQVAADEVKNMPGVNIVLGTNDRKNIVHAINEFMGIDDTLSCNDDNVFEELSSGSGEMTRAYLKIQDGCNRFCTYCIIPYARGRIRSRTPENISAEAKRLAGLGFNEVVLTGIHLMSYGLDFKDGTNIIDALNCVGNAEQIRRIRLGSIDPDFVDGAFTQYVADNKRICRQFHLALQSGSDKILKAMNRHYDTARYREAAEKLRAAMPDCAITTDIIAGFPGETEYEHNETLRFVEEMKFSKIHVFPYSERTGTVAAKMENQVPISIRHERANEIIALGKRLASEYNNKYTGQATEVLVEERVGDNIYRGYTDTYVDVKISSDIDICGQIVSVDITDADENGLSAVYNH